MEPELKDTHAVVKDGPREVPTMCRSCGTVYKEGERHACSPPLMTPAFSPEAKADAVTLPSHYARFKIEPIRFCIENGLDGFQFNIVKYTCRHDAKNGIEDLKKAQRYLEMYIKYLQGDPDWWK